MVLSQKNFPKIVRWSMNIFFEIFSGTLKFLISAAAEIKSVSTRGHAAVGLGLISLSLVFRESVSNYFGI